MTPIQPVDTSNAVVIGNGTPQSVTIAALQAALAQGGSIRLNPGPIGVTLAVQSPLQVSADTVLDGQGLVTFDGGGGTQVFRMAFNVDFTIQNLTVQNGRSPDRGGAVQGNQGRFAAINCQFQTCTTTSPGPDIGGGAIYVSNAREVILGQCTFSNCQGSNGGAVGTLGCDLVVVNCTFQNNRAFGTGGGADQGPTGQGGIGGAIYIDGVHQFGTQNRLVVAGSTFTNNQATNHGGAIFDFNYPGTGSTATIDRCLFMGNLVTDVNGIALGGAVYIQNGTTTITGTTFASNRTIRQGGGLRLFAEGPALIENCTFTDNRATSTTSGLGGAMTLSDGPITLNSLTIADNQSGLFSAGIFAATSAQVTARNVLLVNNMAQDPFNGHGTNRTLLDGGGCIQFPMTRINGQMEVPITPGTNWADPLLQPLGQNGGPTPTRALPANSPALDIGTPNGAPPTDQRGSPRNGPPDVGAFER